MNLQVYWQPGCSSCLKAKEFLTANGIEFESINVRERADALADLRALGARTVPVVRDGDRYVTAQDLRELADFVGVPYTLPALPAAALVTKFQRVLGAARRHAAQIPEAALGTVFKGRDRTYRDLVHHVFVIARAFVECTEGGELRFEQFLETPAPTATGTQLQEFAEVVARQFDAWAATGARPDQIRTFYGERDFHGVLERSVWHAAQHARQIEDVVRKLGLMPDGALGAAELGGLPLPIEIWDDEIAML